MATVKELKEHLELYNDEDIIAYSLWSTEDALSLSEQYDWNITEEEAEEVIETMHKRHDCSQGMNWDVLEVYCQDIRDRRDSNETSQR